LHSEHKSAISLKRVKTEEKLLWGPIGTYQRSFQRHHSSPSPRLGSTPHPKLQSLLSQERVKLRTSNMARTIRTGKAAEFKFGQYIQRVHPNKCPLKFGVKLRQRGCIHGLPIFTGTPYYLMNGERYGFKILIVHSDGTSERKPIKNFGEKGAWAYPGTAQFFSGTPYYLRNE